MNDQIEGLIEILDLIFKWALVKLQDSSNTQFLIKVCDLFSTIFMNLDQNQYKLYDFEYLVIFPLLCEKTGINNNILKDKIKILLKMAFSLVDLKRAYQLVVQFGLNSKNLRAQAECLEVLADFLNDEFHKEDSSERYFTKKELEYVAKMADHSDKNIRENALKFFSSVYYELGP